MNASQEALATQLLEKYRPLYQEASKIARERARAWEGGAGPQSEGGGEAALQERVSRLAVPPTGATESEHAVGSGSGKDGGGGGGGGGGVGGGSGSGGGNGGYNGGSAAGGKFDVSSKPLDPRRYADDLLQLRLWRGRLAWERLNRYVGSSNERSLNRSNFPTIDGHVCDVRWIVLLAFFVDSQCD